MRIDAEIGGVDKFAAAFKNGGAAQFGSGWAGLILKDGKLQIVATPNPDAPIDRGTSRCRWSTSGRTPTASTIRTAAPTSCRA